MCAPLIAAKLKGQEVTEVAQPHLAPVIDLMEALKRSLAEKQAPPAAAPGPVAVGRSLPLERWKPLQRCRRRERRSPVKFRPHDLMGPTDKIQPRRSQRILGLTEKQLEYWNGCASFLPKRKRESLLRFWRPDRPAHGEAAGRKRRPGEPPAEIACCAAGKTLRNATAPLSELRVLSDGGAVIVERGRNAAGAAVRPVRAELRDSRIERIRARHDGTQRDEWLAVALEYEAEEITGPKRLMRMSEPFAWTRRGRRADQLRHALLTKMET